MSTLMELLAMVRGGPRVGLGTRDPLRSAPMPEQMAPQGPGAENWASYTPEELKAWEDFEIRHGLRPRPYGRGRVLPVAPASPPSGLGMSLRDLIALSSKPQGAMPPPRMGPYGQVPVAPTPEEIEEYRRRMMQANY